MSFWYSALQLKIKNQEIDFMFVERPSLQNADSRCMSQNRRESRILFY